MSYEQKLNILLEAIKLAGEHSKDFDELTLSKQLDMDVLKLRETITNELNSYFYLNTKSNIQCPSCNKPIGIEKGLDYCICKDCNGEVKLSDKSILSLGLNTDKVEEFLLEIITNKFIEKGFVERDADDKFIVLRNKDNEQCLALSLSIECNGLRDYFSLRGWANDYHPSTYLILSNAFDKYLASYEDKDLKCTLITFSQIFETSFIDELLEDIQRKQEILAKQKETRRFFGFAFVFCF